MKSIQTILSALCSLVCCVQASAAQAADNDLVLEAKQRHHAAVEDFAQGAYLRAVDGFIAADRLTPRAAFLFNIAKSYDAAHEFAHALAAYRGYLRQEPSAPDAAQLAERVSVLSSERARPGLQQVSVLSQPLGAQVFVDEVPVGSTPITLDLAFGQHTISVTLDGYRTVKSTVMASNDPPSDLSYSLVETESDRFIPVPASDAEEALARSEPAPTRPRPEAVATSDILQIGGFASLGAGVVALGASIAFEVLRASTERSAEQQRVQIEFAQDLESIATQQTLARVFAGSGILLAAVGGVLLGIAHTSSERKPAELSLACTPSQCQGVVSGAF